ncbi:hypothetical protein ABRZ24_11315 [Brenneria populi]|uniref:C2H2-type domain-containing protein n=1 Tax=Brenneria populi TaxID=1505588 RepID=A0ABU6JRE8_9GAMM|nr:hypothetical protein [Brenneria populi Li et al. 2015]
MTQNSEHSLSICQSCLTHFRKVIAACSRWQIPRELYTPINVPVDHGKSIADIMKCYRCGEVIPIFDFERHNGRKPHTVQYRYSKTAGAKYWANTCPNCRALQGHWFLYMEIHEDGSLCHLQSIDDNEYELGQVWGTDEEKLAAILHFDSKL